MVSNGFNPFNTNFLFGIQALNHRLGIMVVKALANDAEAALANQFFRCAFAEKVFDNGRQQFIPWFNGGLDHAVKRPGRIVHLPGNQLFMPGRLAFFEDAE